MFKFFTTTLEECVHFRDVVIILVNEIIRPFWMLACTLVNDIDEYFPTSYPNTKVVIFYDTV